ncbi:MAG: PmoA family protein [Rhodothermales bacterium]
MKRIAPSISRAPAFMLLGLLAVSGCSNAESATDVVEDIQIVNREDKKRLDVYIDQTHFTSYLFSEEGSSLKKPILYPLKTATGINIARGWPFEKKAGERVDHPHHAGHWFNYGDVNGLDFWNHSEQTPEDRLSKMGSIVHKSVKSTYNGHDKAGFHVEMNWLRPDGSVILKEATHFIFHKDENLRLIDRITTLTAVDGPVDFTDNKEGMIAIRVTRALEHEDPKPVLLSNENGEPSAQKVLNNEGVTGMYLSESGISGTNVWGTRSPWMILSGDVEQEEVSIAIIDHPENPGYPTYWHARGYGLFAANPLGQKVFSKGEEALNFHLDAGASTTFRYRIAILNSPADARGQVVSLSEAFAATN